MAGAHVSCLRALTVLAVALLLGGCGGGGASYYLRRNEIPMTDGRAGFRPGTLAKLDGIISAQADRGAIRSGAIVIRRRGERIYANSWGTTAPSGPIVPVTTKSPFDVASLTKPMAGVPCALLMLERLDLDHATRELIPHLLTHTTGFDDRQDFPEDTNVVGLRMAALEKRAAANSDIYRYSNANYLLLTWLGHQRDPILAGKMARRYWTPLGLQQTAFAPLEERFAPVWSGETRSGHTLLGEPYDPIADALLLKEGPPVGHSGLFASADDVALFAENVLAAPESDRDLAELRRWLFGQPVKLTTAEPPGGTIFVTPGGMVSATEPPYAPAGVAPGRYFHHTGYTGCLLWVDTQEGLSMALLTNAAATKALPKWQTFSAMILKTVQEGNAP